MEESRVLIWHRDKLKLSIITDQFLQAVFDHILGRDVVKKLMQVRSGIFTLEGKFQKVFNRKNEKVEESPVRTGKIFFLSVLKKKKIVYSSFNLFKGKTIRCKKKVFLCICVAFIYSKEKHIINLLFFSGNDIWGSRGWIL